MRTAAPRVKSAAVRPFGWCPGGWSRTLWMLSGVPGGERVEVVGSAAAAGSTSLEPPLGHDRLSRQQVSPPERPARVAGRSLLTREAAARRGEHAGAPPASTQRPEMTRAPLWVARAANSSTSRVLPIPGSPLSRTGRHLGWAGRRVRPGTRPARGRVRRRSPAAWPPRLHDSVGVRARAAAESS